MAASFSFQIQNQTVNWSHATLISRLEGIASLKAGQKIQADLLPASEWRWTPGFINNHICGVDTAVSKKLLEDIQEKIGDDPRFSGLFKRAAACFNKAHPSHTITIVEHPLPNLKTMLTKYDTCWNETSEKYEGIHFNRERFNKRMHACGEANDPKVDYEKNYGYIEKKEIPKGSKVYVRADLHGDLKSLIENLKSLQKEGLLDENFKCTKDAYLVFCGDYMDRGENSLAVAEFLATLKMENQDQVFLIRGNHEFTDINVLFGGAEQEYVDFVQNDENLAALNHFYQTMALTLYMGEEDGEYIQFTHGLFELHVDPSKMLDSKDQSRMEISKTDHTLSKRVLDLADDSKVSTVQEVYYLKEYTLVKLFCQLMSYIIPNFVNTWALSPLYTLFSTYVITPPKNLELKFAAKRIIQLKNNEINENARQFSPGMSIYNWGDIKPETMMGRPGYRQWMMNAEDVDHALRLMGGARKVGVLFRGHQHLFQHAMHEKRIVATTLPVGMDSAGYKKYFKGQLDRAYILTAGEKVEDWTKQAFLRESGKNEVTLTSSEPILSDKI